MVISISTASIGLGKSKQDIVFHLNQTDYYFLTGDQAVINLETNNSYADDIPGLLTYTITQNINQGNFQYSSTNSQTTSLIVKKGEGLIPLNFGSSQQSMDLEVSFQYDFEHAGLKKHIELNGIKIHFISNQQGSKQGTGNKGVSAKSKESKSLGGSQSANQQNSFQQQMNQQINNLLNRKSSNQQPSGTRDKLENNQLNQDSQALRQSFQKQAIRQQAQKEAFQKSLSRNNVLQKKNSELERQGYYLNKTNIDAESNNTGNFQLNYRNKDGEEINISGRLENNSVRNLQERSSLYEKQLMRNLENNSDFKKISTDLAKEGFNQTNTTISYDQNKTLISQTFVNPKTNETRLVKATLENATVKKVELVEEKKTFSWGWFVLLILILGLSFVLYYYFTKKRISKPSFQERNLKSVKPFDHKKESLKLLAEAQRVFSDSPKEAFRLLSRSVRIFYIFEYGLNIELTSEELISSLKHKLSKKNLGSLELVLSDCDLVEFAKLVPDKNLFEKYVDLVNGLINK